VPTANGILLQQLIDASPGFTEMQRKTYLSFTPWASRPTNCRVKAAGVSFGVLTKKAIECALKLHPGKTELAAALKAAFEKIDSSCIRLRRVTLAAEEFGYRWPLGPEERTQPLILRIQCLYS
jgi:hypothetical protein